MEIKYLIGLSGYSTSGKDTVAEILRGYGYVRFAFGDHIRRDLSHWWRHAVVGPVPDRVRSTLNLIRHEQRFREAIWQSPTTPEIREALQWWGQYRRWIDPIVWLNAVRTEIGERDQSLTPTTAYGRVCISDVRYPNEYHFVKACYKGEMWRIERGSLSPINSHLSEVSLDHHDFDVQIHNDQGLPELVTLVKKHLSRYDKHATTKKEVSPPK